MNGGGTEPRTRPDAICPQLYHKRINYTPAPAKRKENNIALATLKLFTVSVPCLAIRQPYDRIELPCKMFQDKEMF